MSSEQDNTRLRPLSASWRKLGFARRRTAHSWKLAEELGQPQDGTALEAVVDDPVGQGISDGAVTFDTREPEDARLTGGTRSLMRRLRGLNVLGAASKPVREIAFGKAPLRQVPAA